MILSTISIIVAIITLFFLVTQIFSDAFYSRYQLAIVDFIASVFGMICELPNIMCCFSRCNRLQEIIHSPRMIYVKAVFYLSVSIVFITLMCIFKILSGATVLVAFLTFLTSMLYFLVACKSNGTPQKLSFTKTGLNVV